MLGNFSQLPFQLMLGDRQLHAAICSYSSKVKGAERIPLRLRSAIFKAPRFAPWQGLVQPEILPNAAQRLLKTDTSSTMHDGQPATTMQHTGAHREFWLQCRSCNRKSNMAHRTLYKHNTCMHIICNACGRGASAAKWLCDCGRAWIACQSCRPAGFLCKSSRLRRGGPRLVQNKSRNSRFRPSILTNAGCNPSESPGTHPSVSPCDGPGPSPPPSDLHRPFKMPKTGSHSNLHLIGPPSASLGPTHTNSGARRSLEDTGGDGRTPKMQKTFGHEEAKAQIALSSSTTCVRGTGLCPMTGWTIADYCPACHG